MSIARVVVVVSLAILAACSAGSERSPIQTLEPGVVKIAATGTTVTDPLDPEVWMYRYAERLGRGLDLRIVWEVVPFDKSWELAGKDVVDGRRPRPAAPGDFPERPPRDPSKP